MGGSTSPTYYETPLCEVPEQVKLLMPRKVVGVENDWANWKKGREPVKFTVLPVSIRLCISSLPLKIRTRETTRTASACALWVTGLGLGGYANGCGPWGPGEAQEGPAAALSKPSMTTGPKKKATYWDPKHKMVKRLSYDSKCSKMLKIMWWTYGFG